MDQNVAFCAPYQSFILFDRIVKSEQANITGIRNLLNFGRTTPLVQCMKFMGLKDSTSSEFSGSFGTVTISESSSTEISFSVNTASDIQLVDDRQDDKTR